MSKRPFQDTNNQRNAKKPRDDDKLKKKPTNYMSDDEDEEFEILSQIVETEVVVRKVLNTNIADISIQANESYSQFNLAAAGSSTQFDTQYKSNDNGPSAASVFKLDGGGNPSSQKENNIFQKPQTPFNYGNDNKEQLIKTINQLKEENQRLTGEVSIIRKSRTDLQRELSEVKTKLNSELAKNKNGNNQRIESYEKQITNLKSQLKFENFNQQQRPNFNASTIAIPRNTIKNFEIPTNLPASCFTQILKIPQNFFDMMEFDEHDRSNRTSLNMREIQMKIANYMSLCSETGEVTNSFIDEIFNEIIKWMSQIEQDIFDDQIAPNELSSFEKNSWSVRHAAISKLSLRPSIVNDQFSLTKATKLFPEEVCCVDRRVLSMIAIICRQSKVLSMKILKTQILNQLSGMLKKKISNSDRFCDFLGFVISSSSLLASLSVHMDSTTDFSMMLRCFKSILLCQCDNPYVLLNLSEFLAEILTHEIAIPYLGSSLCVNEKCFYLFTAKMSYYSEDACSLGLFFMQLMTAFNVPAKATQTETEILHKTLLKLNMIALKILEYDKEYFKFLEQNAAKQPDKTCECYRNLMYSILLLSQMAITRPSESEYLLIIFEV